MPEEKKDLSKLQREDHDMLVRLDEKFDGMAKDIKDLKDGTSAKLSSLEMRIKVVEDVHSRVDPEWAVKQLKELIQWKHDFQFSWKFVAMISAMVGGIVGFILSTLLAIQKLFIR